MLNLRHTPIALALLSLYSAPSLAADNENATERMNISITKGFTTLIVDEESRTETGTAITVFTEKDIEKLQAKTVAEVIQNAPGVTVASSGSTGAITSVFIRGSDSKNTVVIIDGVKVTDQSSSSGGFNFAHLTTDGIAQIEVIRGSQSALWGSDAVGGVINITTKKGERGFHSSANLEFGNNDYAKQAFNINGATAKANYSISASNLTTDGISAKTGSSDDPDEDGYRNKMLSLKAGYQFTPILSVDGVLRYSDAKNEYDSSYTSGQDNDVYGTYTNRLAKINTRLNLLDKHWNNRLSISYSDTSSEAIDPYSFYGSYTENSGETVKGEIQSDYLLTNKNFDHRFTIAAETQKDTFLPWNSGSTPDEQTRNSSAVIGEYGVNWAKKIFFTGSARYDANSEFDNASTYKLALSAWVNKSIRLHSSHGTGVKNPTFNQLFGTYGSSDLTPETNISTDLGIEYNFRNRNGYIDLTLFTAQNNDRIAWNSTGYKNQDKESSKGAEFTSSVTLMRNLSLNGQYTYLETEDSTAEQNELLRRPKHSASLTSTYQYNSKLNTTIGINYVGERLDYGYPDSLELDDYTVVNVSANYQVTERFSVYGKIENVLDEDYVVITDYGTDPITGYVGVQFQ